MNGLEEAIRELRELAKKKPLNQEELGRAKEIMKELRKMGFSSEEISELSERAWNPSTIRQYAASVRVENNMRDLVVKMLGELAERGLTLSDVEKFLSVQQRFKKLGVSFEEFAEFLEELRVNNIQLKDLISTHETLKEEGLTIEEVRATISCKSKLKKLGMDAEDLKKIVETSNLYGGLSEVLEAIQMFGKLESVKNEVEKLEDLKRDLIGEVSELKKKVSNLENQKSEIENVLSIYDELKKKGFDEVALEELRKAAEKYGRVKEVLTAVNSFREVKEIERKISEAEKMKSEIDAEIKMLRANYAHLQTVVKLCDELLYKHGFTTNAILDVYEVAKRYGNPIEVIKAIESYGSIRKLEEEIKRLKGRKRELETRISELEEEIQVMRGKIEEVKKFVEDVFEASADSIRRKIEEVIDSVASGFEEYAKRLGELKEEAGKFEEELRIARLFSALLTHPESIKDLQKRFCSVALQAVYNHCIQVWHNPTVKVDEAVREKIVYNKEVNLFDVLELALKAFRDYEPGKD